jgi:hypothetical protein
MSDYIISEAVLREFLDYHAQGMALEDEQAKVLLERPVRFIGAHAEGSSLMLWGEEV